MTLTDQLNSDTDKSDYLRYILEAELARLQSQDVAKQTPDEQAAHQRNIKRIRAFLDAPELNKA